MRLSDLQDKDVVDVKTGQKVGNVIDAEVTDDGNITKLLIYDKKGFLNIIKSDEVSITWNQIKKIGSDVILIDRN